MLMLMTTMMMLSSTAVIHHALPQSHGAQTASLHDLLLGKRYTQTQPAVLSMR